MFNIDQILPDEIDILPFDEKEWADSFCETAKSLGYKTDYNLMRTWFSAALMRGQFESDLRHSRLERGQAGDAVAGSHNGAKEP